MATTYFNELPEDVQQFLTDLNFDMNIAYAMATDPNAFVNPQESLKDMITTMLNNIQPLLMDMVDMGKNNG